MTVVRLPWGAWYQDERHALELPDHWSVEVLAPRDASACSRDEIAEAIQSPVKSPTLGVLFRLCHALDVSPSRFVRNVQLRTAKENQ